MRLISKLLPLKGRHTPDFQVVKHLNNHIQVHCKSNLTIVTCHYIVIVGDYHDIIVKKNRFARVMCCI